MTHPVKPSLNLRLRVLSAIDYVPGNTIRQRIKAVAERSFLDPASGIEYRFTWRTISTWLYRHKKHGITTLEKQTRADKGAFRKIQPNELAEAIHEILPDLGRNKSGRLLKSALYRQLLDKGLISRSQLSPTSFYRMLRLHPLIDEQATRKLRQSFAMQFANELWQADTMHGPAIQQPGGAWRKTFLIAFIDDASRVLVHGEFFYRDDTQNMIEAFRSALFKRGKPERLYFDNGSNYSAREILQACLRLDIRLTHAPVRDGAAKGKIERFFRGFRDRFLIHHTRFESLQDLNEKTTQWIENDYNRGFHSGLQMVPIDRFNIDIARVSFLAEDDHTEEVFFIEEDRKVSKTNVFSINSQKMECPVDLREQRIQVRYQRHRRDRFVVYFAGKRMGDALPLDLHANARAVRDSA